MKKYAEVIVTIILFMLVWSGTFLYSKGVNDRRLNDFEKKLQEELVTSKDFAKQQEQVKSLVKSNDHLAGRIDKVVDRMDRFIEIMLANQK